MDSPNYVAILRAIAADCRTQKEISGRTGLPQGHVSKYLDVLREAGFVQRRVPVTDNESSRKGRYHVADPYLRFYYRFLATRQAQLAVGVSEQALAEIKRHLLDFIAAHTWEELCREWLLRAAAHDRLPFVPDQVGSVWTHAAQVDVVGLNRMEKTLVLGECKWSPHRTDASTLRELVARTPEMVAAAGARTPWRVFYLAFSRGGWHPDATAYARQFKAAGDNWRGVGLRLVTLEAVDDDFARWVSE